MKLRVEWSVDRRSADPRLEESVVTSPEELDRLLDDLDARAERADRRASSERASRSTWRGNCSSPASGRTSWNGRMV
jgi:hypothetical protein